MMLINAFVIEKNIMWRDGSDFLTYLGVSDYIHHFFNFFIPGVSAPLFIFHSNI